MGFINNEKSYNKFVIFHQLTHSHPRIAQKIGKNILNKVDKNCFNYK